MIPVWALKVLQPWNGRRQKPQNPSPAVTQGHCNAVERCRCHRPVEPPLPPPYTAAAQRRRRPFSFGVRRRTLLAPASLSFADAVLSPSQAQAPSSLASASSRSEQMSSNTLITAGASSNPNVATQTSSSRFKARDAERLSLEPLDVVPECFSLLLSNNEKGGRGARLRLSAQEVVPKGLLQLLEGRDGT
ncbi:hypothetical protein Taro_055379 [Colocasia esculenta]|uniref:Uncharacterized protein n=1 Tax=Colocasia esculenta TaxID=4460 RepID=A0A843XQU6_COLES|nr:hypothetical protein [Colocasia esculenta]